MSDFRQKIFHICGIIVLPKWKVSTLEQCVSLFNLFRSCIPVARTVKEEEGCNRGEQLSLAQQWREWVESFAGVDGSVLVVRW